MQIPFGRTDEFNAEEIVRQRTICGPILCSVSTYKVNKMAEKAIYDYGSVEVEPIILVDDICGVGDIKTIEKTIESLCCYIDC